MSIRIGMDIYMPLGVLGSGRAFQSSLYKGVGGLNDHIKDLIRPI